MGDMSQAEQDRLIDYIEFLTTNIEETKRFYRGVFGWEFTDFGPDPRWSLQNRPMVVTAKAANGDGPGQCCFTPLNRYRASPFWYASSGDRT